MSNEELLSIEPQELQFPFELKKQISCSMQVTNKTQHYVAFKVKTTNPKKYCVRPNNGIVLPRSTCVVIVTMQSQNKAPPDMQCKDKFLLQSIIASPGTTPQDISLDLFNKESGNQVEECKLKVKYVPPTQPMPPHVREGFLSKGFNHHFMSYAESHFKSSEFEMDNHVDDSTTSHNTRSDQICSTEVIDITIEDAKNKKELVNSAMDSVLSLLSEVEQIEKFAEEGDAEARRYTLDIFAKMEELEHMQQSAKEANDKLQEFLIDRTNVVDMLREYSIYRCQDVNMLKKELKYYEDENETVDMKNV